MFPQTEKRTSSNRGFGDLDFQKSFIFKAFDGLSQFLCTSRQIVSVWLVYDNMSATFSFLESLIA